MSEVGSLLLAGCSDFPGVTQTGQTSNWRADADNHVQGFTPRSHLVTFGIFYKEQLKMLEKTLNGPHYERLWFVGN